MKLKTKHFIISRKIDALLPWFGIAGVAILIFTLIMNGMRSFFTEIGYIAVLYYFIDEYNWIAERITFDKVDLITHKRDKLVHLAMWLAIILATISIAVLTFLKEKSFLDFVSGVGFISGTYFGSRAIENLLIIFKVKLEDWRSFYLCVAIGSISIPIISIILYLYVNLIVYAIFLAIIGGSI